MLLMGPTGSGIDRRVFFTWLLLLSSCLLNTLPCDNSKLTRIDFSFFYFDFTIRIGKTLLAKTLARIVNVPFTITDATALTQVRSWLDHVEISGARVSL